MDINKKVKLILHDVNSYDIEACHYTILNKLGFDLSDINPEDKLGRNIKIGQMMKANKRITHLLRKTTESIIDDYITKNNVLDDEIIIRQYDGIILTRQLQITNIGHIPLERRQSFQQFVISIDRKKFIARDNENNITLKGIPYRYPEMDKLYIRICNIIELSKDRIFYNLQKIKDEVYTSQNPNLFGIPTKQNKMIIFLKGYGEIEVSESTLKIIDTVDIDRQRYFDYYIKPFAKSIVFENVR